MANSARDMKILQRGELENHRLGVRLDGKLENENEARRMIDHGPIQLFPFLDKTECQTSVYRQETRYFLMAVREMQTTQSRAFRIPDRKVPFPSAFSSVEAPILWISFAGFADTDTDNVTVTVLMPMLSASPPWLLFASNKRLFAVYESR
jgi:hypothetical protein